jgi:hypothetical protein
MPKFSFDIDTYKTRFDGGLKQYLFFVLMNFPNFTNIGKGSSKITSPDNSAAVGGFIGSSTQQNYQEMLKQNLETGIKMALTTFGMNAARDFYPYFVRSTSLPSSNFEEIPIPYQITDYKLPGRRTFDDWTITFNIDAKGEILQRFLAWHDGILNMDTGDRRVWKDVVVDQQLHLLDYTGETMLAYTLVDAWPKTIGQVGFDYGSEDIATVDITFSYRYYTVKPTETAFILSETMKRGINRVLRRF